MPGSAPKFVSSLKSPGEPCAFPHMFDRAWDECIELQVMDKQTWTGNTLAMLADVLRAEIGVVVEGRVIGGLILTEDHDVHVGRCWSVVAQYVLPEYRNQNISLRCMREAIRVAKLFGAPILAYTHRIGDWRYATTYRKLQ